MNTACHDAAPTYRVGEDGVIWLNDAGQALKAQYKDLKAQVDTLDHNWCDAVMAALFLRHPWVGALTLRISSSWEYNDSGGCYPCGYCRVDEVGIAPCAVLPDEILDDGKVDTELAADLLNEALYDDASELALTLLGEDRSEERTLSFTHEALLMRFDLVQDQAGAGPSTDRIPSS